MELNLPPRYQLTIDNNGAYSFITEAKVVYKLVFTELLDQNLPPNYCGKVFDFSFYPNEKNKYDQKVSNTINYIIKEVFKNIHNILIFICDTSDNRHHARLRLFINWFRNNNNCDYEMDEVQISNDETSYHYHIIYNKNNKYSEEIIEVIKNEYESLSK